MDSISGIKPLEFVHILDLTTNVTRVEIGPRTLVLKTNERLVAGPHPYVIVPPGHYCFVRNPIRKYEHGKLVQLKIGQQTVKLHGEPFVLYPGEELVFAESFLKSGQYQNAIKRLPVISANCAIKVEAEVDIEDGDVVRQAGDRWQIEGPCTWIPQDNVSIVERVEPVILGHNEAVKLRASQDCTDFNGRARVTAECWLVTREGAYLPGVYEQVVEVIKATSLTENLGVHLEALQYVKFMGKSRKPGEQWLVTAAETDALIPPIGVKILKTVNKIVLAKNKYCVVVDPVDKDGHPQLGVREVRKGISHFFLHPGESLEKGIENAEVLSEYEALVLQADKAFTDTYDAKKPVSRTPGDRWMIHGPADFIPCVEITVVDKRRAIPLAENSGIYVRNIRTGCVRDVMGPQSYMLNEHEILWEKKLSPEVEDLLKKGGGAGSEDIRKVAYFEQSIDPHILKGRNKTHVVTYRCPGNTACQVYNYMKQTARVIFGPDLVVLGPHENFNVLSLSAGKPKKPHALKSLALMLGPDFITDVITVETSDHARLSIKVAFNNFFEYDQNSEEDAAKLFSVPDFIGYACSVLGSKIRASVAQITFDEFHRNSAEIIQFSVFGNSTRNAQDLRMKFSSNLLVVTGVDIQSIEPVDTKMRDSLMKSVQMAIEIATSSVEAAATHDASRKEQAARGKLERQKLMNLKGSEVERTKLLELRAEAAAVESAGQAVAEAQAESEKTRIECESEIEAARLKAEASKIEHEAQLETQNALRSAENRYQARMNELEITKERSMANLEVDTCSKMIQAIGKDTVTAIATAGPEAEAELLASLGLSSVLFTDGSSPINLFNTAKGLISQATN